jgi:pimeloyl-ACP methyl ester carboxylesterase
MQALKKQHAVMRAPRPAEVREDDVRAQLELGCSGASTRVIVSPGSGCTWADHWYVDLACKIKAQFGGRILCTLQWSADFEAVDRRAHPSDWKSALVESQILAGPSDQVILLGHSSGGNAALRAAERNAMHALIVIGAGYSQWDRQDDGIPPWKFDAIVANVRRRIVVLHGSEDHVIPSSEGDAIAQGLREAVARAGSAGTPELDIRTRLAGVGHTMQQQFPPVLLEVLSSVARQVSLD